MAKKGKKKRDPAAGDVATNRRARHKFELVEKFEAGIVLRGSEVKSLRNGKAQMSDAYAVVDDGEVWLRNLHSRPMSRQAARTMSRSGRASCCFIGLRSSGWSAKRRSVG